MIKSYEDSINYLEENGWVKNKLTNHEKGGLEIVFDTSHYVEVYDTDTKERIDEGPVDSVDDIISIVNRLKFRSE